MKSFLELLRIILHARRKGLLHLRKADKPMRLECIGGDCGLCCDTLGAGVVVTEKEAEHLGEEAISRSGGLIVLKSEGYSCSLLKNKACSCYSIRPQGCHEYPWYRIDGQLYYDAGCPGMKNDRDERPEAGSISHFERYLAGSPGFLQNLIKHFLIH